MVQSMIHTSAGAIFGLGGFYLGPSRVAAGFSARGCPHWHCTFKLVYHLEKLPAIWPARDCTLIGPNTSPINFGVSTT